MRFIVTGASGWLGRAVLDTLQHGPHEVRAMVLPSERRDYAPRGVSVVEGDVRNAADCAALCRDMEGATLLHLAGVIHPRRVADFYAVNVEGTRNVLQAAARAGVRRAVVVSSNSPCGCNPNREHRFDEQSPYNPYLNYGRSKMLMEQAALGIAQRSPLQVVIVRAPWFYGPFQPPRQTEFFRMIRDGRAPIVGDGGNRRSMAYVGNLAQGLLLAALNAGANGRVYWIADERPYTMCEIIDTVERLLEREFAQKCRHTRLRLPGVASELAYAADRILQRAGLYHQKIHVLSEMNKNIACSVERAKRELGYRPTVALEEGMRQSLRWIFETRGRL
jgi:nucleoside-diphosphate-sugar epimerase